jgi:hypothetical protein
MKITTSDKIIAYLTLLSGLTISGVAIWYSVAGLVAIFSAAVLPIIIMGVVLEVSKLVATVWLKTNWSRAPVLIRTYLTVAIATLMVITSLGIFGFLSKAHSDQSLVGGDVQSRISLYDEKIKIERENIDNSRQLIQQMDAAVNGVITTGDQEFKRKDGSTGVRSAAERSLQIRRAQSKDRTELTKQIEQAQTTIVSLQEQRAPIAAEVRKVEAEVGPIKYIAAFVYGDNPDANVLEKAVTWVIIIIVAVFDPLAVILLLASQYSFQWFRKAREEEYNEDDVAAFFQRGKLVARGLDADEEARLAREANDKLSELEPEVSEFIPPSSPVAIDTVEHAAQVVIVEEEIQELPLEDTVLPASPFAGQQFRLVDKDGSRIHLVFNGSEWVESPLTFNENDTEMDQAAQEAMRWAQEQAESKKKTAYMIRDRNRQITKTKE